jgi:hypothetical protein
VTENSVLFSAFESPTPAAFSRLPWWFLVGMSCFREAYFQWVFQWAFSVFSVGFSVFSGLSVGLRPVVLVGNMYSILQIAKYQSKKHNLVPKTSARWTAKDDKDDDATTMKTQSGRKYVFHHYKSM